jgi:predicted transcriptional regulator
MESSNQEARILLAIQAFQNNRKKHIQPLAIAFNIPNSTLYHRIHGRPSRRDRPANSRKLTD